MKHPSHSEALPPPSEVPPLRLRALNSLPPTTDGQFVLYWMTAFRRIQSNFALQYARDLAMHLGKPLVVVEALRIGYRWASDRFHRFIIEGMVDNALQCESAGVTYYPYVEPSHRDGESMIFSIATLASAVVTDDYPCFFHPAMLRLASRKFECSLIAVDSNCLMPLRAADRTFTVAHSYRRFMQKTLPNHLAASPDPSPLASAASRLPTAKKSLLASVFKRWPPARLDQLLSPAGLESLPIDHSVRPTSQRGGTQAATQLLKNFIERRLTRYDEDRNEPDSLGSSELSPYLHFGHISPHEVFEGIMKKERWTIDRCLKPNGKVNGFWNVSPNAEAFLDQLCTWREIGFNMCSRQSNYHRFDSLPDWAIKSLTKHKSDPRTEVYTLEQFERAKTRDPIWNAAQRQLVREGRIHNYLRMLWGKKILHWAKSPEEALKIMIELNNKYALDGRDPNSYSGIFWVLGRYDRAWGPERPIFGSVRYMTSENTAKKHALKEYLKRFAFDS